MKSAIRKGFGFGVTSGIIAALGMMIGLERGTHNVSVIISGVAVIAVTDALSDAFAIFMADEAERSPEKTKWEEAASTFISKFLVVSLFILPFFFFNITQAITLSVSLGLISILILTYFIAKNEKRPMLKLMLGHLGVTILVILVSALVGQWAESLKETPRF